MCFQVKFPARETPKVDPTVTHGVERETLYKKISEVPEGGNKTRKSGLRSFGGMIINHMI